MTATASPEAARPPQLPPPTPSDWREGRVMGWVTTLDHKRIGVMYIVTSLLFFLLAGLMALLMRSQLATPDAAFMTRDAYNQLFTMHGTAMIFFVVVPVWAGFANYLVPLMIGARDMAFPRINAWSYWTVSYTHLTLPTKRIV